MGSLPKGGIHYHDEKTDQFLGPYLRDDILHMLATEKIADQTLVWFDQLGKWKPLHHFSEIQDVLAHPDIYTQDNATSPSAETIDEIPPHKQTTGLLRDPGPVISTFKILTPYHTSGSKVADVTVSGNPLRAGKKRASTSPKRTTARGFRLNFSPEDLIPEFVRLLGPRWQKVSRLVGFFLLFLYLVMVFTLNIKR